MTRKNAEKDEARRRQRELGGSYAEHLRAVREEASRKETDSDALPSSPPPAVPKGGT